VNYLGEKELQNYSKILIVEMWGFERYSPFSYPEIDHHRIAIWGILAPNHWYVDPICVIHRQPNCRPKNE